MKERETYPGKTYAVRSADGCTITDINGDLIKECAAGQDYFVADVSRIFVSDDNAKVQQVFNLAPQQRLTILGVLGGNSGGSGLPTGYKQVEWLEAPDMQFIETDISIQKDYVIFLRAMVRSNASMLCSQTGFSGGHGEQTTTWGNGGSGAWFGNTESQLILNNFTQNVIHECENAEKYRSVDGVRAERPDNEFVNNTEHKWGIFNRSHTTGKNARIYYVRVTQGDKNIIELVPCLDKTGAPCMYDKVSRKAYYNSATGDFTYPTESTTYALRRVLPDWGQLTTHGLRRLYHAPVDYEGELIDYALENGYKPIIEPEMPEDGYWIPQWRETEDEIILEWIETEEPVDEFLTIPTEQ